MHGAAAGFPEQTGQSVIYSLLAVLLRVSSGSDAAESRRPVSRNKETKETNTTKADQEHGQTQRPGSTADLTRPTADGARGRRPKITGESALGVEQARTVSHLHRAQPPASVSSSRFQAGEAACLPETVGSPLRRSHTLAHTSPHAQKHDHALGQVCGALRWALAFPRLRACTNQPDPLVQRIPFPSPGAPSPQNLQLVSPCVRHL